MNGFKQASQTTITMREDQILVINVEAGDASEIGLHKFEVKLQKKDGSTVSFAPDNKVNETAGKAMHAVCTADHIQFR